MKIEETRLSTGKQTYKVTASYGKVLMRKADGQIFGNELTLGNVYYLGGVRLVDEDGKPCPHWEEPSDYIEVDEPQEEEMQEVDDTATQYTTDLDKAKEEKIKALYVYDKSGAVNEFFYNGEQMWFPLTKRQGANGAIQAREILGQSEMTYTLDNGVQLTLPLQTWRYLLAMVEVYAQDCYNVTASHAANIKRLANVEEVMEYDFTTGYPDKISL